MYFNEDIDANYDIFIGIVDDIFSESNKYIFLIDLLEDLKVNIKKSPATRCNYQYSCYEGGWLNHALNKYYNGIKYHKFLDDIGFKKDYSDLEYYFLLLFGDIAYLGRKADRYYKKNNQEWNIYQRGEVYVVSDTYKQIPNSHLALKLLNDFDVHTTENEHLYYCMYDEDINDFYLKDKTKLPFSLKLYQNIKHVKDISVLQEKENNLALELKDYKNSKDNEKDKKVKEEKKKISVDFSGLNIGNK